MKGQGTEEKGSLEACFKPEQNHLELNTVFSRIQGDDSINYMQQQLTHRHSVSAPTHERSKDIFPKIWSFWSSKSKILNFIYQ